MTSPDLPLDDRTFNVCVKKPVDGFRDQLGCGPVHTCISSMGQLQHEGMTDLGEIALLV